MNVDGAKKLASVAQTFAQSGVTVYPVLLQTLDFPDENAAYQASYTLAQQIVNVQRYAWYEVTNELAPTCLNGWVDGARSTDFKNDCFQIARGVIRGLIAGIKSVDPDGKIIIGGNTWMHYGFDVMLANGTQPDGTSGHPVVTWDITAWHWYSEQGRRSPSMLPPSLARTLHPGEGVVRAFVQQLGLPRHRPSHHSLQYDGQTFASCMRTIKTGCADGYRETRSRDRRLASPRATLPGWTG
jgi:hypothetical protein